MNRLLLFALFLSLSSCITIGFQQPQPAGKKSLDAFPSGLWGEYDDEAQGRKPELIIRENSVYLEGESEIGEGVIQLGDTLVLKKFKGFYIASYWLPEEGYWIIHPFKTGPDMLYVYNLDLDRENAASTLSPFTRIIRQEEDFILINPKRKELRRMLKDQDLWEIETLYRIKK